LPLILKNLTLLSSTLVQIFSNYIPVSYKKTGAQRADKTFENTINADILGLLEITFKKETS